MNAILKIETPITGDALVRAYQNARTAMITRAADRVQLTVLNIGSSVQISGTTDNLIVMFRDLANEEVFGWFDIEMGADAKAERPDADSWCGWWDDRVDEPLLKFNVTFS